MANPITWTNVTDEAPELSTVSVAAQTALLDYVNTKIVVSGLDGEDGRKTFLARVYWAAHVATMLKRRGQTGALTSQASNGVSESFAVYTLPQLGVFGSTGYGQLYAMIIGSSAHRAGLLNNRRVFCL